MGWRVNKLQPETIKSLPKLERKSSLVFFKRIILAIHCLGIYDLTETKKTGIPIFRLLESVINPFLISIDVIITNVD